MGDKLLEKFAGRGPGRPRKEQQIAEEDQYREVSILMEPALIAALDVIFSEEASRTDIPRRDRVASRSDLVRRFCQEGIRRRGKRAESKR